MIPKPWQVSIMLNTVYEKKDIVVSVGTRSGKSLPYQLIFLVKEGAIMLIVSSTIALMSNQIG